MSNQSTPPVAISASTESHHASNSHWRERQRLASELRQLANQLLCRNIAEEKLGSLADHIQEFNRDAARLPELAGRKDWFESDASLNEDSLSVELSPLIGKSSCVGPVMKVWVENGEGRAELNCDWRFEGPPKCVHGGYVAAFFDEFLGWTQMLSGGSGATKNLSVTYHKPTPLNTDLVLKARLSSVEGKKIRVTGEMYAGELMTASAEGLFISFGKKGTRELYKKLDNVK